VVWREEWWEEGGGGERRGKIGKAYVGGERKCVEKVMAGGGVGEEREEDEG